MDESFQQQIEVYEHRLNHLLRDGLDLHRSLSLEGERERALDEMRAWQRECAATISQLSGGSKQHWLSRAYSEAFLLRTPGASGGPEAANEAGVETIIERIVGVLRQAQASLAGMRATGPALEPGVAPRRFTFVHNADLQPGLERAFSEAQAAFDRAEHALALLTWASILEAILTDALEQRLISPDRNRSLAEWTFTERIAAAEQARLISAGCARLPDSARSYRDLLDEQGELKASATASERDAKVTGQVLRLIMRDLAPGR
jgi:hypothetical protein